MKTLTPLQQLVPRGLYRVGTDVYESKVEALIAADRTGLHPTWDFHDDLFSLADWTREPEHDLSYYYTLRCHQIRDSYQYLVLHYSAGSDSHNILSHFYKANLHIDQINVTVPLEYYNRHRSADTDRSSGALHNEWYHVIKPDLEWISQHMPKTKVTLYDSTKDILEFRVDQDWILHAGEHCNPNFAGRVRYYDAVSSATYDSMTVAHIYGVDKPRVFYQDGAWYFAFLDSVLDIQSAYRPVWLKHDHIRVENFYWSPDLTSMLIKQAHLVKQFYQANPDKMSLATMRRLTPDQREQQQEIIKSVVYPNWRNNIFQVRKAESIFFKEFDQWFFDFASPEAKGRWYEGFNFIMRNVNPRWVNFDQSGTPTTLTGFWSKWHRLGI